MKTAVFLAVLVFAIVSVTSRNLENADSIFFPGDVVAKPAAPQIKKPSTTPAPEVKDDRKPVLAPGKCAENQLLYPAEKKDAWECDCAPGFIWNEQDEKCYAAFTRGPCKQQELFVFVSSTNDDKPMPKCIKNSCKQPDEVKYKNQCWPLHKVGGPCPSQGQEVLQVNPDTMLPECLKQEHIGLALITAPKKTCYPGTKRFGNRCRAVYYRFDKNSTDDDKAAADKGSKENSKEY